MEHGRSLRRDAVAGVDVDWPGWVQVRLLQWFAQPETAATLAGSQA